MEINLVPLELLENLKKIQFKELKISFAFGNPNELLTHPIYSGKDFGFAVPFAGSVFRVHTMGKYAEYFKIIKLLSGLFNSEMRRPLEEYFVLQGHISQNSQVNGYFFHSNGFQILNTNMMIPILRLLNHQNNHKFLSLLDPVNIFTADYISFELHIKKDLNELQFSAGINFIHNPNSFDFIFQNEALFRKRFSKSLRNKHASLFLNNRWKNSSEFRVSYSDLKSFYMETKPVFSEADLLFAPSSLSVDFYFQKSFVHIQNAQIVDLTNRTGAKLKVNLQMFFSIAEEPILHQIRFEPANCKSKNIKIFTRPHKTKEGDGSLNVLISLEIPGEKCQLTVPYFQKHKNFEELDSDHLVYYVIPGVFADYYSGQKAKRVSHSWVRFG